MPELLEVECYRQLALTALDRVIVGVATPDEWIIKGEADPATVRTSLEGDVFVAARRRGKLLLLDTGAGPTLGVRFGMTGVLEVDGRRGIHRLEYGSARRAAAWTRFAVRFADGGELALHDPRRLGGIELDPDEGRLGPDATTVTEAELQAALAGSTTALKTRLMDQRRIAGLGNLLTDDLLWRAGLDPARPAGSLSDAELEDLHRAFAATLGELAERGGSHTGELQPARAAGGVCPLDGAALVRQTVGGRTTWSCPEHQR